MPSPVHPKFGTIPIPRYVQIAELFRQRLSRGQWEPGAILPSIDTLMNEFEVSRVTIRQAVHLLAQEGLLSPERGRGTFVTEKAGRKKQLRVETTLDDLVEMYRGDIPDLLNIIESYQLPETTEKDGIAAPKYFHMRRVHSRDGERYCVISIYIDDRVYQREPDRFRTEVILPLLTSLPGIEITKAHQTLDISTADMEVAKQLDVPVNSPVAEVRRVLGTEDGTIIYLADVTYRGDYVHLEMDLKP
jgi:GntR family transcriptional regulator